MDENTAFQIFSLSLGPSIALSDSVYSRCACIGSHKFVSMTQNIVTLNLVIEGVESKNRILLGLVIKLPL